MHTSHVSPSVVHVLFVTALGADQGRLLVGDDDEHDPLLAVFASEDLTAEPSLNHASLSEGAYLSFASFASSAFMAKSKSLVRL